MIQNTGILNQNLWNSFLQQPSTNDSITMSPDFMSSEEADIAWMLQVKNGDIEAFEQLVRHHQSRVVGTVAKMLGDDRDAEDIAQQVFVRIWKSAANYNPTAKFTTWLYTITRNLVFNEIRRRSRHPQVSLEHTDPEFSSYSSDPEDPSSRSPQEQLLETELQEAIHQAILALPESQRMAVILRRYDDLSYEEIAQVLETTVSAVKSLLFRARTELRQSLAEYLTVDS